MAIAKNPVSCCAAPESCQGHNRIVPRSLSPRGGLKVKSVRPKRWRVPSCWEHPAGHTPLAAVPEARLGGTGKRLAATSI
ncbi:MAG: hypothetical protein QM537_08515 [Candidatus Symbiobacter sp.]|nr:hypothetical protein [Candidatus Symbiobacter sp.]